MKAIPRQPVRDLCYRRVLEKILRGQIPPSTRIRDTEIAAEMEISRTPAREILLRLTQEGYLENLPGRGFRVCRFDIEEVSQIYPIVWTLEALALRCTPAVSAHQLKGLESLGRQVRDSVQQPLRCIDLDERWHDLLISSCPNDQLKHLIKSYKRRIRRYLYAYILRMPRTKNSLSDHETILNLLSQGNIPAAADLVEPHWRNNLTALKAALEDDDE